LLAQLQNQQTSVFSQPFAVFGGGSTLFGVGVTAATANFSASDSRVKSLQALTLRAAHGNAATMHIGARYPLLNATFAPIFNTPALAQVIQDQSFQAPFPSFNYEDIGVTVKATPLIQGSTSVSLQLELQIRALGSVSFNGIPVIATREYKGAITLMNGEPAAVVGMITESEQKSMRGIPGVGSVLGLAPPAGSRTREVNEDELLVVVTPHIVSTPRAEPVEIMAQ
jgi:general secretion pathway protein D